MEYPQPGALDDIHARPATRRPPDSDQVEIRVHATGLNFIDAMRALGVYPGQHDGPVQVGIECAGTVTAVGEGVGRLRAGLPDGLQVGDAVIALAMDGVGSFVTTPACLVAAKPADLSFEAAATLPIAFLTAYYAFHEQARLRRNERVLIHSAAGGVGLAAIEVARWLGATVHATAGTPEKRDHLRALGIEHVSDSRSLAFADEVLAATDGEGVDVVLNSLTGEAIAKGLAALRPYGRFLEIGKRDIYGPGRLRLWQLRNNASYMVIDLAQLIMDRPAYVGALLRDIVAHIDQGTFRPLPVRTFPVAETAAAVRCLAQGKHIGKVAVAVHQQVPSGGQPAEFPVGHSVRFDASFTGAATYLVTGGLGGIGQAVARWMVQQGARHLVLMGRGPTSKSAQETVEVLQADGAEVVVARGDVAQAGQLSAVLKSISRSMPPLRGIVHAAGVLDDGILARLDERRVQNVMAPKVDGAWNLHTLTQDTELDFFVLFSSAASILGSPGQAHYSAANAFLDALAWHRHALGRPALSINWGPWADVGLAARPERLHHVTQLGVEPMPAADGIRTLSHLLRMPATQVAVLYVDWAKWRNGLPGGLNRPLLADLGRESVRGELPTDHPGGPGDRLIGALRGAGPMESQRLLESYLRDQLASKLGLTPSRLDIHLPISQLGVDSLVAVELRTQIERDLGLVVPVVQLLDGQSVSGLADWLGGRLSSADPAELNPMLSADPRAAQPNGAPGPPAALAATDVAGSRWMDLLAQLPEVPDDAVDELLGELLAARERDHDG
jgi:NADPH:quinone reductase-like Zn-dependent oxidoreductase/acyl carrier protein